MSAQLKVPPAIPARHPAFVLGLNTCLFALGVVLVILASTVRRNLTTYEQRTFPIYPEGRPTSGSVNAPYFPAHLETSDNAAQIALGCIATLYGGVSTTLLYLQYLQPRSEPRTPLQHTAGWVAMLVAGAATTLVAAMCASLSFRGNDDSSSIDLRGIAYWPWQAMFPTIQWSVESWTCKVHDQLSIAGSRSAEDFAGMCEYTKISKWLSLILMIIGLAAVALGASGFLEQKHVDRRVSADLRVDPLRDPEKNGKEP